MIPNNKSGIILTILIAIFIGLPATGIGGAESVEPTEESDSATPHGADESHTGADRLSKKQPYSTTPSSIAATPRMRRYWQKLDDPGQDAWDTELFNIRAGKQLDKLKKLITDPQKIQSKYLKEFIAPGFSSSPLRPSNLIDVYEDKVLRVKRAVIKTAPLDSGVQGAYPGVQGFVEALEVLLKPLRNSENLRAKFKIFRIQKVEEEIVTRQYFAIFGDTPSGRVEMNATWVIQWHPGTESDAMPRLKRIGVADFEQVVARSAYGPQFVDITKAVLGANDSYGKQMLRGLNHWLGLIENTQEFALFGTPGIAVGDVNGDGLEDLYLCQEHGLPNRLFIQNLDGTARDVSRDSGTDWLQSARSALLVDLDNDADQDLVVATFGNLVLAANDGKGHFEIRDVIAVSDDTMSLSAVDYDNDGDLDLYATGYNPNRRLAKTRPPGIAAASANFVYHDANNGALNYLLRNDFGPDGKWSFADVTDKVGMGMHNTRFSMATAWEDYDNDGDQDLYVANDYGRDSLYRNELIPTGKARFVDVADMAHIEDSGGGMSISWGDFNRDGWMDAYISGMWSSAGNRVTFQPKFKADSPLEVKTRLQRFARGNTLLKNLGNGTFEDVSAPAAVEVGRWAWGSRFIDLNNDGWQDLIVANGFLTGDDEGGDL